ALQFPELVQVPPLGFPQPPATIVSVKVTGVLLPMLPAASVSLATMLCVPLPGNVMLVLHAPPVPIVAVPICVPLSYNVTIVPGVASVDVTVPAMVCVAWLVVPPVVLMATTGATVSIWTW